jgi:hypothetical protein
MGEPVFWAVVVIMFVVSLIVGSRGEQRTIRRALPGTWKRRWGRMTTTWNGHPASAKFHSPGESEQVWAIVEIGVSSPVRLRVTRGVLPDIGFGDPPLIDGPFGDLKVRSDDPALAHRLFADPVMARTLPLTLRKTDEEIMISNDAVRVTRFAVDDATGDALHSAWSLATGIVTTLSLGPPQP